MKKILILTGAILGSSVMSYSQLTVNNTTMTPTQLVQNVLVGAGVTVSNVTFNGVATPPINPQVGSFSYSGTTLGIPSGLIMGSGNVQAAIGPNNSGSLTMGTFPTGSDPDLLSIAGANINDEAVLEFDFVPLGDSIKFRYAFASEEYPEFVGSFNDAFGFFLSGPGIAGPYTNGAVNVATIPVTGQAVTINNVNAGNYNCPQPPTGCMNCAYYVDNCGGTTVQYDGLTVTLTAAYPVQCGQTYHIKLAIADALDHAWDSGVFLEEGSFSSEGLDVQLTTLFGNDTIVEGCPAGAIFSFMRPDTSGSVTVTYDIGGDAINGVDYSPISGSVTFPSGIDSVTLVVTTILDSIVEGVDSLVITVYIINVCGDSIPKTATLYILDPVPVFADAGPDQNVTCPGQTINLTGAATGGIGLFTYLWSTGAPTINSSSQPLVSQWYTFTVSDGCSAIDTDSMYVTVPLFTPLSVSVNNVTVTCPGDPAVLFATSPSGGTPPYTMVWSTGSFNDTITVSPMATTSYTYTVTDNCGLDSTVTATVTVPVPGPINVQTTDGDLCQEADGTVHIPVSASGGTGAYLYSWISTTGSTITVDGATGEGIVYNPVSGNYIVVVSDACGNLGNDTATVVVKPCALTIPNVISPNGDGMNDVFFIKNLESHPGTILTVYNRWGLVMYESNDYKNDWKAPDLADGVYFYTVKLSDNWEPSEYHGFFHLYRTK